MKILFATQDVDFYTPLGLMQISAMAKQRGDETYLTVLSREDILDKIKKIKPDIVAYSCTTGEHKYYANINKKIKSYSRNIFTIAGGPHATFFPEFIEQTDLDAICIGEGEYPFQELLERLERGKDISGLENIIVKGGKLNGLKPLIQNLDALPFPDRELFYRSNKSGKEQPTVMNFMTSRGCPYNCTYCFNHSFNKTYHGQRPIRKHSVDYAINEILDTKEKFNFKFIRFMDDIFVFKEDDWFKEFCTRYPKEVGLPFYVHSRFDLITPTIVDSLKNAGCKAIHMSIESTNPKIRKEILKRNMSDAEIIKGAKYCQDKKIPIVVNTMLGLPTSTLKDDINAVDFSIKAGVPIPEFPIYQPYPRTDLGELCVKNKWFDGDMSKIDMYGFTHRSILSCFTEREKNAQVNISLLGPLVVRHPSLRNIVINHLIYLPTNKLFNQIYTIEKMMVYPSKVYKLKYSLKERLGVIRKSLRLEKVKRSKLMEK